MYKILVNVTLLLVVQMIWLPKSSAQKQKLICDSSYRNWDRLGEMDNEVSSIVSPDGFFFVYRKNNLTKGDSLILQSTKGAKRLSFSLLFSPAIECQFTTNSQYLVFKPASNDSLTIVSLKNLKVRHIDKIQEFKFSSYGNKSFLAYRKTSANDSLFLEDINGKLITSYNDVKEYFFNKDGRKLIQRGQKSITVFDFLRRNQGVILENENIKTVISDKSISKLAILCETDSQTKLYAISLFDNVKKLLWESVLPDRQSTELLNFNLDGSVLFFKVSNSEKIKNSPHSNPIIFSYNDPLPFESERTVLEYSLNAVEVASGKRIKLSDSKNRVLSDLAKVKNTILVDNYQQTDRPGSSIDASFISINTGEIKKVGSFEKANYPNMFLSPNEKYIIFFDPSNNTYKSYSTANGKTVVISSTIPEHLYDNEAEIISRKSPYGFCSWLEEGESLLVYGKYDIWKMYSNGGQSSECVTGGYGKKNEITLRCSKLEKDGNIHINQKDILLVAFNNKNKDNGFFKLDLGTKTCSLTKLTMGPYVYQFGYPGPDILVQLSTDIPQKAIHKELYIIKRQSVNDAPNLFSTVDFKTFIKLTDINPQREYNWVQSKLIKYDLKEGKTGEGILFVPENFDNKNKYPLIFHFYEKLSNCLNLFPGEPISELNSGISPTWGIINIPWYVSNGYLVFVPNIYYERNNLSSSISESILGAINSLSKNKWIDTLRLGIQGHSFGAFETATILTRTNKFAAAQLSNGYYNSTSYYNHKIGGTTREDYFLFGQGNIQFSPWARPDLYLENSPIFKVYRIKTPTLILHNDQDENVPYYEGRNLFSALRSLNKPTWILNYPGESHSIENELNKKDFTKRQQQFFDYYLKKLSRPTWLN